MGRGLFSQTKREIEKTARGNRQLDCFVCYLSNQYINQSFVLSPRVQFLFDFHLFADDSNLFLADSFLECLETRVNQEFQNVHYWLCASRLSLNVDEKISLSSDHFRKS